MDKPPDDPALTNKSQDGITIDGGELEEDSRRNATADDFRRDWEKRGRPRNALGVMFEITEASKADPDWAVKNAQLVLEAQSSLEELRNAMLPEMASPLYASLLSATELERLSIAARQATEIWPRAKEAQAVAESFSSWKAIQDSALKLMQENSELLTGLLPKAASLAALSLQPSPEAIKRMAELAALVGGPARMPLGLESMCALSLRQLLTETLSQGAVQYIRQTTRGFAKERTSPTLPEGRGAGTRTEEVRAGEKPVSPKTGEMLLNTAAKSLALLDAELQQQAAIVRTPAEWEMLEGLKAEKKTKEISRWLNKSAQKAIRSLKQGLGVRRGRKPKAESEKEGYKLALKVEAILPQFEKAMQDKKELKRKLRLHGRRLEARLCKLGYSPDVVECLMGYSRPLSAACAWVSEHADAKRDIQTIQNYHSKFRSLIPQSKPDPPEKKG